jgi:hypothetical protein
MIIAEFADKYNVPPARVHRSVRSLGHKALARKLGIDPESQGEPNVENHALEATLEQGVRVTISQESSQFSYRVLDEEALYDWLRKEHGQDLLSDNEISHLLEYARYLFVLMKQEGVRPGEKVNLKTASGQGLTFEWEGVTKIERLLWRSGQIENKTFSSE